jgi:hypothetical protein
VKVVAVNRLSGIPNGKRQRRKEGSRMAKQFNIPKGKDTGLSNFGISGPSVEQAQADMLAAKEPAVTYKTRNQGGKVPSFMGGQPAPAPHTAEDNPRIAQNANPVPAEPSVPVGRVPQIPGETARQRFEGSDYTIEIFREANLWVAEIQYVHDENGQAGSERFTGSSMADLTMHMAKGKSNATRKIRQQNRAIKEGFKPDGWKEFHAIRQLTQADVDALDPKSREVLVDGIQVIGIQAFIKANPSFQVTQQSWQKVEGFLKRNGNLPVTQRNIDWAYRELTAEGQLESTLAPQTAAPLSSAVPIAPPTVSPIVEAPVPAPASRKRGSSGLIPGQSSAAPGRGFNSRESVGDGRTEEQIARAMPLSDLRRAAIPSLNPNRGGKR